MDAPLISGDELARLLTEGTGGSRGPLVVADVRWYLDGRSGRAAYEAGHVPGAVFVPVEGVLAGPGDRGPGRHPLPGPAVFAAAMAWLGIGDDTFVVAYDDAGGSVAARLWWMLRATGHRAAVLDGGIAAWPGELEIGEASPPSAGATFTASPWPDTQVVDAEAVASFRGVLLDARAGERYRGEVEPIDPHAGHIPGALSAPWTDNLDASGGGRFLAPDALRARFASLGVEDGTDVIAYCGSGITACHALLALEVAGLAARARLYEGSWSDWCAQPSRPMATGASPGRR